MAGFTTFFLQLLTLCLPICLDLRHPPSSNQSSLSPPSLASSRFSLVVLTFYCHSLQDPEQPSKHFYHPSSAHVHLTPFSVASRSIVSFNPNMSLCSSVVFLSTTFRLHIALKIALSVLLKIAFSFSFKHYVSLPYSIADLMQQ